MNPRLLLIPLAAVLLGALGWVLLPNSEPQADTSAGPAERTEQDSAAAPAALQTAAAPRLGGDTPAEPEDPLEVARIEVQEQAAAKKDEKPDARRTYRGRVINSYGRAVPDAEVSLRPEIDIGLGLLNVIPMATTTTDNLGNYEILGLGKMRLKVEADGYEPYSELRTLAFSTKEPIEDAVLEPGVILHGVVVAQNGATLGGAGLFLLEDRRGFGGPDLSDDEPDIVAGDDGYFEFTRVEQGEWSIAVRAGGRPLRIFEGASDEAGRISPALRLEIPPGASIAGSVTGLGERDPAGYRVRAMAANLGFSRFQAGGQLFESPDAEGRFEFDSLDPDLEYDLALVPDGMSMMRASGMAGTRSEPLTARPGEGEVELAYLLGKFIRLQLVNAADSAPVTEAEVRFGQLMNMNEPVGSDGGAQRFHADGKVLFADVHASEMRMMSGGKYRLEIQAPGFVDVIVDDIEIAEDEDELDLGLIELERAPMLEVTVIEAGSGDPVKRAVVRLDSVLGGDDEEDNDFGNFQERLNMRTRKGKTGSDGIALIESFGQEPARLQVTRSGYARVIVEKVVVPKSGDKLVVELALEAALQITVVMPDGRSAGEVRLRHRFPSGETDSEETDGRGRLRLRKLEAGTHAFRLTQGNRWWDDDENDPQSEWSEITLAPGADVDFELLAPARYSVTGTVTAGGQPVARADVKLQELADVGEGADSSAVYQSQEAKLSLSSGRSGKNADADSKGNYEIDDVLPGEYFLVASRPEAPNSTVQRVTVRAGANDFDIQLTGSTVRGRVIDESGRPVVNARLDLRQVEPESEFSPNLGRFENNNGRRGPGVIQLGGSIGGDDRTDNDGRFELLEVPEGVSLAVFVSGSRMIQARSEVFTVEPDSTTDLEIDCRLGGALAVAPSKENSAEMEFVRLRLRPKGTEEGGISGWSWGGTLATFDGLAPGTYTVEAFQNGFRLNESKDDAPVGTAEAVVRAGEETEVSLVLP